MPALFVPMKLLYDGARFQDIYWTNRNRRVGNSLNCLPDLSKCNHSPFQNLVSGHIFKLSIENVPSLTAVFELSK